MAREMQDVLLIRILMGGRQHEEREATVDIKFCQTKVKFTLTTRQEH